MKHTKKLLALLLCALLCLPLLSACGETQTPVSVCLVNRSGHSVGEIYLTSATDPEWGDNRVQAPFQDGDLCQVPLGSFAEETLSSGFQFLIYDDAGMPLYDTSLEERMFLLDDGNFVVLLPPEAGMFLHITGDYQASDYDDLIAQDAPDAAPQADLSAYAGYWKYDTAPFYMYIDDAAMQWSAVNLYGEQVGPGALEATDEALILHQEDGSMLTTLAPMEDGSLCDADGDVLRACDAPLLLPTPDDALDQTASFPGDFGNVQICYPSQMESHEHGSVSNALSFNAIMEDGTDDYFSNIMVAFQPISGYDSYMTQGAGTAKPYMEHMLEEFLTSMYGDRVLKSLGSDFVDGGDYYGITGYLWLDGSLFETDAEQPVRGCMEVRYYGPTGYALVAVSLALEGRIQNYFEICSNMLETCSYSAGWSTSPKQVPAQPAQSSDSGDAGTPYYWYDEDGDVWYWNGYENEFIGYGDSYYIDGDQYYESNDAGWDDGWGDYVDDYDPWSDPGDGWEDYSYDDEGWGDYFD